MNANIETPEILENMVGTGKKTIATIFITTAIILALEFGAITAAFAGTGIDKTSKESVRREIIRHISCPEFITENSAANDISAVVALDENGKVTLYEIDGANAEVKKYVANVLKDVKVMDAAPTGKFVLVVKFRVS